MIMHYQNVQLIWNKKHTSVPDFYRGVGGEKRAFGLRDVRSQTQKIPPKK